MFVFENEECLIGPKVDIAISDVADVSEGVLVYFKEKPEIASGSDGPDTSIEITSKENTNGN